MFDVFMWALMISKYQGTADSADMVAKQMQLKIIIELWNWVAHWTNLLLSQMRE